MVKPFANSGRGARIFVYSAAAILIVTGLAKIFSALPYSKLLMLQDPIFRIPFRALLLEVGFIEVFVALFCLSRRPSQASIVSIAFLAYNFVLYRIGLWWIDFGICPCMGSLTQALGIPPKIADITMTCLAAYLFIGSTALMVRGNRKLGQSKNAWPSPTAPSV
jgi:hypothetical protein